MTASASDFMEKAGRNLKDAHLLFADGSPDGACNRAYYAMFNAARAALLATGHAREAQAKTHSGLIAAFAQHIVRPGLVHTEHNRAMNRVQEYRLLADYIGDGMSLQEARDAIEKAEAFLIAIDAQVIRKGSGA